MKKKMLFIFILFISFISIVNANEINHKDVPEDAVIIGTHMFSKKYNYTNSGIYSGAVTSQVVMMGSSSLDTSNFSSSSDFIIYRKAYDEDPDDPVNNPEEWINSLTGNKIPLTQIPETFTIYYINGTCVNDGGCSSSGGTVGGSYATFNSRSDDVSSISQVVYFDEGSVITEPVPGHVSDHDVCWTIDDGSEIDDRTCFEFNTVVESGTVFEAKYTPKDHKIYYDLNGGTGRVPDTTTCNYAIYNANSNSEGCKLADIGNVNYDGYVFAGWSLDKLTPGEINSSDYLSSGTSIYNYLLEKDDVTLYAVWKAKPYRITINYLNGEDNIKDSLNETYLYSNDYTLNLVAPEIDGYKFVEWTTSGSGFSVDNGVLTVNQPGDVVVNANYDYKVVKFVYRLEEGNIPDTECSYEDDSCRLSDYPYLATGEKFLGWKISDSDVVLNSSFDHHIFDEEKIIVTPVVEKIDYTATIDLKGGTGDGYKYKYNIDDHDIDLGLNGNNPVKFGYTFDKWYYANEEYVNQEVDVRDIHKIPNLSIYASYTVNDVTFEYYDGSEKVDENTCSFEAVECSVTVEDRPSTDTKEFVGWLYNGVVYESEDDLRPLVIEAGSGTIKLNAYYTYTDKVYYDINYDFGECEDCYLANNSITQVSSTTNSVDIPDAYRKGYDFDGWKVLTSNGEYVEFGGTIQDSYVINNTITLLANSWTPIEFRFNFFGDGIPADAYQTCTYDVTCTLAENINVTRDGYVFKGWALSANSENIFYGNGINVTNLYDTEITLNLYAVWAPTEYRITYYANGGTLPDGESVQKYYEDTTSLTLVVPTKEGNGFRGWKDLDGNDVTAETLLSNKRDITLVAQWSDRFDLLIKNGSNSDYVLVDSIRYGTVFDISSIEGLTPVAPDEDNIYRFLGWFDEDDVLINEPKAIYDTSITEYKVHAEWTNEYNLLLRNSDDEEYTSMGTCIYGVACSIMFMPGQNQGFRFLGYYDEDEVLITDSVIITDTSVKEYKVHAEWTDEYDVYYKNTSESEPVLKGQCQYGATCSVVGFAEDREGYRFLGYSDGETIFNDSFRIDEETIESVTIVGKWTDEYTVIIDYSFETPNGREVSSYAEKFTCQYNQECPLDQNVPTDTYNRYYISGYTSVDPTGVTFNNPLTFNDTDYDVVSFQAEWIRNN